MEATCLIETSIFNVAGVKIPKFSRYDETSLDTDGSTALIGLTRGGEAVQQCKAAYSSALQSVIRLATLQVSLTALDEAIRITNRRVNALEFIIIPQLENTVRYVISELHELEREDTFRIKKVKDVRARQAAVQAEEDSRLLEEKERRSIDAAHHPSTKLSKSTTTQRVLLTTGLIDTPEEEAATKSTTAGGGGSSTTTTTIATGDLDVGDIFS
uniref:V-type proton ATPase subunit D n=1 Tax=Lygus hesperus TaxID=30085 RepID=A0A0A9YVC9_LYGHE